MKPQLHRVGTARTPVVVIDDFRGRIDDVIDSAAELAPFETNRATYYPGLRRIITEEDLAANAYVESLLRDAAQFIAGAFDVDGFDLLEASFSMVTTRPDDLIPAQRVPHFDSTDPKHLAVLHYLGGTSGSGTAFFRQNSTGIELVDEVNVEAFVAAAKREGAAMAGYFEGSNNYFERIGAVEAVPDRLIVYPGSLLHSGTIPPDMMFSSDPRTGRLTTNIFVLAH